MQPAFQIAYAETTMLGLLSASTIIRSADSMPYSDINISDRARAFRSIVSKLICCPCVLIATASGQVRSGRASNSASVFIARSPIDVTTLCSHRCIKTPLQECAANAGEGGHRRLPCHPAGNDCRAIALGLELTAM